MSLVSPVTQLWKLHKPDHLLIDFNRLLKYRWESLTQNSVNKMNEKQIKPTCFPFPRPSLKCRLALHNKYIFPFLFLFHFQQVYIYTTILSPTWTAQKPLHFLVRDWLPPAPNAFKQFPINYRPYMRWRILFIVWLGKTKRLSCTIRTHLFFWYRTSSDDSECVVCVSV